MQVENAGNSPVNWTDKERMFFVQIRPKVFKAILTSVLAFIIFSVVYFLVYFICGLVVNLLLEIPVIGRLIDLLFFFRGDTPDMALSILSPGIAFFVTMAAQEKLHKDAPTKGLSCVLLGIIIVLLHIVSLFVNLIYGNGIFKNIVQIIAGFIIFSNGMGELKENKT